MALHVGHIVGLGFYDAFQLASSQTLYDDGFLVLLVGHVDDLHQFCESSLFVEVFCCGIFGVLFLLTEDTEYRFWILLQHVYQFLTLFSAHHDRGQHSWENYQVACAEGRIDACFSLFNQHGCITFEVGNHLDSCI